MTDEQYLLANAYIDDELTVDERLIAEADPDVMSEVEQLQAVRAQLRRIDPPTASARESAMAAAMAAFPGPPLAAPPINAASRTVPIRRRPAYTRLLGWAAAVVAVGILGVVVVTGLRSGDQDDSASFDAADLPAEEPADEPADEPASDTAETDRAFTESAEIEPADDMATDLADGGDDMADDSSGDAGPVAPTILAGDAELAAEEPAEEPADEPASDDDAGPVRPTIDPAQPLDGPLELGAYGSYLLELRAAEALPPTPNTACPQPGLLAETAYLFDDVAIDVFVVVDEQERTVSALDRDTCETLVVGPLF